MSSSNGKPQSTDQESRLRMPQFAMEGLQDRNQQVGQQLSVPHVAKGVMPAEDQLRLLQQGCQNQLSLNQQDNQQLQILSLQAQAVTKDLINSFDDSIDGNFEIDFVIKGRSNK